jgi:hypothetical protein
MLAISVMGATPTAVFYVVAVVLFILSGIGFKPVGDRVHLVGPRPRRSVLPGHVERARRYLRTRGTVALDANRT